MFDIFDLTLRQLLRPRRLAVILLVAAVPVALAIIASLVGFEPGEDVNEFRDKVMMRPIVVSAVLPIITLVFATAVLGHEVEDHTLGYLFLKPIPRWQIVASKLLAALAVSAVVVVTSGVLTVVIAPGGGANAALAVAAGLLVGVAAYGALFTWAGLMTNHALALGLVYVLVWEVSIAGFLRGVRYLSVRQYTLGTIQGIDDGQFTDQATLLELGVALPLAAGVFVVFALLTVRRLTRMDVP